MFVVARNPSHLGLRPMTQLRLLGLCSRLRRASNSTAETASPAFTDGVRAQQQMSATLTSIPAGPVLRPQIVIGGHEKVYDGASSRKPRCLCAGGR
jgi:hypothetical protein